MTDTTKPAAALRAALRNLLTMFRETLGDQAGATALKTATERALSEVIGATPKRATHPPKAAPRALAKPPAKKAAPAPKREKKKVKPSAPSPGRLRQIAAMKEYWKKKKKAEEEPKKESKTA